MLCLITEKVTPGPVASAQGPRSRRKTAPHSFSSRMAPLRSIAYIDGFNLYYRAIDRRKATGLQLKWLDLGKLLRTMLPKNDILRIKYFTAPVDARPGDPLKPFRQQVYWRALSTIPGLEIIKGIHRSRVRMVPSAPGATGQPLFVAVIQSVEKNSDVNLASHLVHDGCTGAYDCAVLVSSDTDQITPLRMVKHLMHKKVIVLHPTRKLFPELRNSADYCMEIRQRDIVACQFPSTMRDAQGTISIPGEWLARGAPQATPPGPSKPWKR